MSTPPAIPLSPYTIRCQAADGSIDTLYAPQPIQDLFHSRTEPNVWIYGPRGTGKSVALRNEAHGRALAYPKFPYAIVRRTMPELRKSHLSFIDDEMQRLGGYFNKTESVAYYPNGSKGFYTHVGDEKDLGNLLSAEFYWLGIDEAPTIPWTTLRMIAGSVRVPKSSGPVALTRYGGNPIGESAGQLKQYFIDKDVDPNDDPDYIPAEWQAVFAKLSDNTHIDEAQYRKQFAGLPAHVRKAWLEGEFVVEGAYFIIEPQRHFLTTYPNLAGTLIYRAVDWGTHDAAVCLWIAVYASGRAIVFKERSWTHTTAKEVATAIKAESQGMRIVETFCDPTMFPPEGSDVQLAGNIFEANGVPLTRSRNDRTAAGFAVSEWLNTPLADGLPKIQIYSQFCPMLTKTLPEMRTDPKNPSRLADGNDHWTIALAYFCMAQTVAPRIVSPMSALSSWRTRFLPENSSRRRLGSESVRRH